MFAGEFSNFEIWCTSIIPSVGGCVGKFDRVAQLPVEIFEVTDIIYSEGECGAHLCLKDGTCSTMIIENPKCVGQYMLQVLWQPPVSVV